MHRLDRPAWLTFSTQTIHTDYNVMKDGSISEQRFIPFNKADIVAALHDHPLLEQTQRQHFLQLSRLLGNCLHHEFHGRLEAIKSAYANIDPDRDTRDINSSTKNNSYEFAQSLQTILNQANYEQLTEADLQQSLREESLFKIRLQVDFEDFDEVVLYARGESLRNETLSSFFGLRKRSITFTNYDRVVLYLRFSANYENTQAPQLFIRPGTTLLKLFRNVPKADLEMLFPNTQVRMKLVDKLLIGVPAAISGGVILTTKLGGTLILIGSLLGFWLGVSSTPVALDQTALLGLLAGLGALLGYLWKQFSNFKNRKIRFMKTLAENLYFKNLDNNAGVFYRLFDEAEEEECKEAILAYFFLLQSESTLTSAELDRQIESWLQQELNCELNFEIGDALNKLKHFGLVTTNGEALSAIALDAAIGKLSQRWDDYA